MTKRFEIIPRRHWYNPKTNSSVSFYGTPPFKNPAESADWIIKEDGYTYRDNLTGAVSNYKVRKGQSKEDIRNLLASIHGSDWHNKDTKT